MAAENPVAQHYASAGIAERVLAALRAANGADAPVTPDALAPLDHFHGRGVVATAALAELLKPLPGERILDIGCGIGGPARWIAAKFGCHVTGVDLTPQFCEAARALTAACGLEDRVAIVDGSATDLPLPDGAFDRAYSHNVIMNIEDKPRFCREALRVLRPGGVLALAAVCAGPGGEPYYPQPWATTAATSFLASVEDMRDGLLACGFELVSFRETSGGPPQPRAGEREPTAADREPALGVHVVIGDRIREMRRNGMRSYREGRLATIEALVRKPM